MKPLPGTFPSTRTLRWGKMFSETLQHVKIERTNEHEKERWNKHSKTDNKMKGTKGEEQRKPVPIKGWGRTT